jgi:hypothetical protein
MNQFTTQSKTTTDKTNGQLELPADAGILGTDSDRATHYYSQTANTVVVVDTADLVERHELGAYSLLTWVTYIAHERGWRELREAEQFIELLADAVIRR